MASAVLKTAVPILTETYYSSKSLRLYSFPPPPPPTNKQCRYGGSPRLVEVIDRYKESIQERILIPSTPPDVSITLQKCLHSSTANISHVWLAQVQASSPGVYPSQLVAKIYDPVWFDDAEWYDPFQIRNLSVSQEVESYRRFKRFQGTKVPRFYGHFITPLPSQQSRTVNVVLMEYIPVPDLRRLVPPDVAGTVCAMHKDAIVEAVVNLRFDMDPCGVVLMDLQPRNVILLPPKDRREFCISPGCPLRLEGDCENLEIVMIDFERVKYREPRWNPRDRRMIIDRFKPQMLSDWLEGDME